MFDVMDHYVPHVQSGDRGQLEAYRSKLQARRSDIETGASVVSEFEQEFYQLLQTNPRLRHVEAAAAYLEILTPRAVRIKYFERVSMERSLDAREVHELHAEQKMFDSVWPEFRKAIGALL